ICEESGSTPKETCNFSSNVVARDNELVHNPSAARYGFGLVNQGCRRISSIVNLSSGLIFIMPRNKERAAVGTFAHRSVSSLPLCSTYSQNSYELFVGSSQGVFPTSITNSNTPQDQISTKSPLYSARPTSGAT